MVNGNIGNAGIIAPNTSATQTPISMRVVFSLPADCPAGQYQGTIYTSTYPSGQSALNISSNTMYVFANAYVDDASSVPITAADFNMSVGEDQNFLNTPVSTMIRSGSNAQPINPFKLGVNGIAVQGATQIVFTLNVLTTQTNADAETDTIRVIAVKYPLAMALDYLAKGIPLLQS